MQEASVQLRQLQLDHDKQVCEYDSLKQENEEKQRLMEANECYFQAKMQNIENEFHLKEMQLNQLLEEARMEMEENKSSGLNA